MDIQEQCKGAVTVLKPIGPLSQDDVDLFSKRLHDAINKSLGRIVVDISAVPYVDSQGLEMLVDVTETLSHSGQGLKLCALNATLREVFDLTGAITGFDTYEDVNSAVRSFL